MSEVTQTSPIVLDVGRLPKLETAPLRTILVPSCPVSPFGIVKFKTAADALPEFTTDAGVPDTAVVVVPIKIVESSPLSPLSPFGIEKSKTAADRVPEFVTVAGVPAAPVEVVPTVRVAASPLSP